MMSIRTKKLKMQMVLRRTCGKYLDTMNGKYKHLIMKHTNLCNCFECEEELYTYTEMARHIEHELCIGIIFLTTNVRFVIIMTILLMSTLL